MSRTRITTILLSMFAGGLIFGPALSSAHDGRDSIVAYADPGPEATYARHGSRPVVAQAPIPPKPPKTPKTPPTPPPGAPIKIDFNGHHIDLGGIEGMVRGQLDGVREMIRNNPNIPKPLRDKLVVRIDKIRSSVYGRLARLRGKRLSEIGSELEQLGDEVEQALEGLDEELEQLGDQLGKNFGKQLKDKKWKFDFKNEDDSDDSDDSDQDVPDTIPMTPDLDSADDGDMRDAVNDLKGMAIRQDQKDRIAKIRAKSDAEVKKARSDIEELSRKLETALANPNATDDEIGRMVDSISGAEARIRKARLIAWVSARRVLDDDQRKRIEAAAAKKKGH